MAMIIVKRVPLINGMNRSLITVVTSGRTKTFNKVPIAFNKYINKEVIPLQMEMIANIKTFQTIVIKEQIVKNNQIRISIYQFINKRKF